MKINKENADKEKEEERKKEVIENKKLLVRLCQTYNIDLDYMNSPAQILEEMLKLDQNLRLAHYLIMNRNDWNDGYDYAECGLSGYKTNTEQEKLVYQEVNRLIDNWDGDGRCFHDSEYGYDFVFGLVDKSLVEDYNTLIDKCGYEMPYEYN